MFRVEHEINIRDFRRSYGFGVEVEFRFCGEIAASTDNSTLWAVEGLVNDYLEKAGNFSEATGLYGVRWGDFLDAVLDIKKMSRQDYAFLAAFGRFPESTEVIERGITFHKTRDGAVKAAASEIDGTIEEVEGHLLNDWEMVAFGGMFYIFDRRAY